MTSHQKPKKLLKNNDLKNLLPGDVLLFRTVYHFNPAQRAISWYQSLTSHKHGHYETVHAGICIGHDKNGEPLVAHVTEYKGLMGYFQQPLKESNIGDKESRSLIVFRHKDSVIRETIANDAANVGKQKKVPHWSIPRALELLLSPDKKTSKPGEISQASICSKFVIEILQRCTKNDLSYPDLPSTSSPKALEGSLSGNAHFDRLLYTGHKDPNKLVGQNPYLTLYRSVEAEYERLKKQRQTQSVKTKVEAVRQALSRHERYETKDKENVQLERSEHLLKEVMPVLKINTGWSVRTPDSYQRVSVQARQLGIFRRQPEVTRTAGIPEATGYRFGRLL